jgi:uncharacterized membrane protein YesL
MTAVSAVPPTARFARVSRAWMTTLVQLAYLNLLWIAFSLLGLGVAGIFPATAAAAGVIKRQLVSGEPVSTFTAFRSIYREQFLRANALGWIHTAIGTVLVVDVLFLQIGAADVPLVLRFIAGIVLWLYVVYLFVLLPTYVTGVYESRGIVRRTISTIVQRPLSVLGALGASTFAIIVLGMLPALIPIIAVSLLLYIPLRVLR